MRRPYSPAVFKRAFLLSPDKRYLHLTLRLVEGEFKVRQACPELVEGLRRHRPADARFLKLCDRDFGLSQEPVL